MAEYIDANKKVTIQVYDDMTEEWHKENITIAEALDKWTDEGCPETTNSEDIFYDGYAYCLIDFGKDTVLCKDCKHWDGETHGCEKHPSAEPWWETDSCNYGERKEGGENE